MYNKIVKHVSIKDARANLKALLDRAHGGEEILILRHGKPVARLGPPPAAGADLPDLETLRASASTAQGELCAEILRRRNQQGEAGH